MMYHAFSSDTAARLTSALDSLTERRVELSHAIAAVLHYLVPDADRRTGAARRSGTDRRDRQDASIYAEQRSGRERRASSDRRLPPVERLRLLRHELNDAIERQTGLAAAQENPGSV